MHKSIDYSARHARPAELGIVCEPKHSMRKKPIACMESAFQLTIRESEILLIANL
jgi:hypothetical protein